MLPRSHIWLGACFVWLWSRWTKMMGRLGIWKSLTQKRWVVSPSLPPIYQIYGFTVNISRYPLFCTLHDFSLERQKATGWVQGRLSTTVPLNVSCSPSIASIGCGYVIWGELVDPLSCRIYDHLVSECIRSVHYSGSQLRFQFRSYSGFENNDWYEYFNIYTSLIIFK